MYIPLTGLTTVLGVVIMFGAWAFLRYRMSQVHAVILRPVRLLHGFFLYMAAFFALMSAPFYWLIVSPELFPVTMAWGYVLGHIFLYLALMNVARMTCALVPRLANKERWVIGIWLLTATIITLVNTITMVWGAQPSYDYGNNIVHYNAATAVGAGIGLMATISLLPAIVLFLVNAFKTRSTRRVRSLILGIGFLLMMVAGPLHDVARTGTFYAIADIVTTLSMIIVGIGVVYRLEQSLSPSEAPAAPAAMPSSNTV